VQDSSGELLTASKRARLMVMIERTLAGKPPAPDHLARLKANASARVRAFNVTPRVLVDNEASSTHTIIEINGLDRPGLLREVTLALTRLNLQIASAKISTYGHKAIDVFYVKDIFGMKVTDAAKERRIRHTLLAVLDETAAQQTAQAIDGARTAAAAAVAAAR
jgi:[protein-PII] uridylyltransferase